LEETRFEKLPVSIYPDEQIASKAIAQTIAKIIKDKQALNKNAVLGLATGKTPISVYQELVRMHQEEKLSFKNVITFNLDEYYPMKPYSQQSYVNFMYEHLFNHIDIDPKNIHIPDGTLKLDQIIDFCVQYEQKIEAYGGIDLQILGIGRTGHIGFNEPGSAPNSGTRLVTLDDLTKKDAAQDFGGKANVPTKAITMGIGTILKAKKIILMAWNKKKASIIKKAVEGKLSSEIPATYLQSFENVEFILDQDAASALTRFNTPWLVKDCIWNAQTSKKAVIWLAQKVRKPILKLTEEDYNNNGMAQLATQQGPIRLINQDHQVHVAYQTSGNTAVWDEDVLRFMEFAIDANKALKTETSDLEKHYQEMRAFISSKQPNDSDLLSMRTVKGLIRKGEAIAGARFCGLKDSAIHFLNLPFYETGKATKNKPSENDLTITLQLMQNIKPHQIFVAGDFEDPHGTHKVCFDIVKNALEQLRKTETWTKDCNLWLYRGAWHEFEPHEIEMAVPLSPKEVEQKRLAIFKHQSQKDRPIFPGDDAREFWQRAEDRNKETAYLYNQLGLAEYEALEAFVKWKFE